MEVSFDQCRPGPEAPGSPAKRPRVRRRTRWIAMSAALTLPLLRMSRVLGQEDEVGYRRSYYQEDDNRINVTTDTANFDIGLRDNIRVTGDFVIDAISGATPSGAPPQTKWPFPTFNNYYQSAYPVAYGNQYNQFITDNQIYVDSGLETYQQLTNDAAAYAVLTAPGIATNTASGQYQTLTNNPNIHNSKVPLVKMHDRRTAFSLGVPMTFGPHQITPSFAYSRESDYLSYGGALNYSLSLNDKNTTLSTGWSHNGDTVRDDLFKWQPKTTDDVFLGLVQLFGPKAYLTVNASLGFEEGYLADPYRGVMLATELQLNPNDPALSPERRPRRRTDEILYTSWTQFITPLNGSYELNYRFFHDSYGIFANTAELDWHQKIGKHIVVSPMFRYYIQNSADFYYVLVPDYSPAAGVYLPAPKYYSSDYRLSEFESFATGITFTWRIVGHLSLDLGYMRYIMRGLDGATSQSAYPSANVFNVGLRVWF